MQTTFCLDKNYNQIEKRISHELWLAGYNNFINYEPTITIDVGKDTYQVVLNYVDNLAILELI